MFSKEKNSQFENASAAMKRVMIAKDVIGHLKVKNILPYKGKYFDGGPFPEIGETTKSKVSLQEVLPEMKACKVCAIGGMFYSSIAINNKFKADVIDKNYGEIYSEFDGDEVKKKLGRFFSNYQMALIETAFESEDFSEENGIYEMSKVKTLEFSRAFYFCTDKGKRINSQEAIVKIMNNIIENEGAFKP
jgi:hypothetical protein